MVTQNSLYNKLIKGLEDIKAGRIKEWKHGNAK